MSCLTCVNWGEPVGEFDLYPLYPVRCPECKRFYRPNYDDYPGMSWVLEAAQSMMMFGNALTDELNKPRPKTAPRTITSWLGDIR